MNMKKIEAQIMGQAYTLACPPDSEASMQKAIHRVDDAMNQIREAGKIRARDRIAVLAALNIAFDMYEGQPPSATNTTPQTAPEADLPAAQEAKTVVHPRIHLLMQRMEKVLTEDGKLF